MHYTQRVAESTLQRYLNVFPVVGITGPRQSGKSTLLKHTLPNYTYLTFDDPKHRLSFQDDPEGFLSHYTGSVIFDEVQYVPDIFHYVKLRVDIARDYGKIILTSSSQFQFLQHINESLAGRIGLLSLLPFQYSELPKTAQTSAIFRGSYPELVLRDYVEAELWYGAYLDTYLSKDVRTFTHIGNLRDFHRFLQLLASNVTQIFEASYYARDLGITVPTIQRWLSVLEASYIVFTLPPYYENYGKRITKRPKLYFYDTGLVSYLTGIMTFEQYDKGPLAGSLFENYIVSEVIKRNRHTATPSQCYYFRTQDGAEIDLIIDNKTTKTFIEIKKSATFQPSFIRTLNQYAKPTDQQLLLYQGQPYHHRNVICMPYGDYLL